MYRTRSNGRGGEVLDVSRVKAHNFIKDGKELYSTGFGSEGEEKPVGVEQWKRNLRKTERIVN